MTDIIHLESPQANINRAQFAGKDFFTFVDDIVARVQLMFVTEFNDFVASGTGMMMIDIVSWAAETLSFYIDRQATESYLSTARTRRAVQRLSRQLGYRMRGAVSSSVDLEVNLRAIYGFDVPIPQGFRFSGPGNLVFEATEEVVFPAGEGPLSPARTVSVREGTTRVEVFVSDGTRNQVFVLTPGDGKFVATASDEVIVDGVPWSRSNIITFDQTNQYEISDNAVPPNVRFGNGVAGNVPTVGSEIRVEYLATSGRAGQVMHNTIESTPEPLVVSFQQIGLTITNPMPTSGGDNQETIEETKANAPGFFNARNVAVTQSDYVGLSNAFVDPIAGNVAIAQAFVARSAADDLTLASLIQNIRDITEPMAANVVTQVDLIVAAHAQIDEHVGNAIENVDVDISAPLGAIVTNPFSSPTGSAIAIRNESQTLRGEINGVDGLVTVGLADATLIGKDATLNDIRSALAGMEARVVTVIAATNAIEQSVSDVNEVVAEASASLAQIATPLAAVETSANTIEALVTTAFEAVIGDQLDAIYNHVDGFLSDDCKANLVQVPVLTRDVDGFLQGPSIALRRSLNTYLDARKEITQVVEVVSGAPYLVRANINGVIGVREGFIQATVLSNVRKAIDDLLRVRAFGKSLRLSDIYARVVPNPNVARSGIEGVDYAVFTITGPGEFIDGNGNIVITRKYVVTRGNVFLLGESSV